MLSDDRFALLNTLNADELALVALVVLMLEDDSGQNYVNDAPFFRGEAINPTGETVHVNVADGNVRRCKSR